MVDRREKSFFAPVIWCGVLVVFLGAACFLPLKTCGWCSGTGSAFWNDRYCFICKGRGRVAIFDRDAWQGR